MDDDEMNDSRRFPLLNERGRALLKWMHDQPAAPRFNHRCGDRLDRAGLRRLRQYEAELRSGAARWQPGELPPWLAAYCVYCQAQVPFYRRYGLPPGEFLMLPTVCRTDLGRAPWDFVPDDQPLDGLILYATSGTTGHPVQVLSHPEAAAQYFPLFKLALERYGVQLECRPGKVAVLLMCYQHTTVTYATVLTYLNQAGFAKLNLNPADWRQAGDRERYLDACNPEVYTGDPLSFAELARLSLKTRPKALVSGAMHLSGGFQRRLEERFGCPVIDMYSLNEGGPVGVRVGREYALLPRRLYVEIMDTEGRPCPLGVRGEVTLSGEVSRFLHLLRYRTGDFASLSYHDGEFWLVDLEGRQPVVFRGRQGQWINNVDITGALRPLPLVHYALHQAADGGLRVQYVGAVAEATVAEALRGLFGGDQPIELVRLADTPAAGGRKAPQYSSELDVVFSETI